jgi:(p)ppGpp synthase/HD superfamily hydrolase
MTVAPGLEAASERSELVRRALARAREAHGNQTRDNGAGPTPFIDHLLEVAEQLAQEAYPDQVIAAGLLHDVVESGGMSVEQVRNEFGDPVAHLVEALSERKEIDSHAERKDDLRRRVAAAGPEAQAIYAADKLSNIEALREGYRARGEDVDVSLKVPLDEKVSIWESDLEMLLGGSGGASLVNRLADALAELAGERASV